MTPPTPPTPPDQAARDRIATDLGATLFVEAGAGSGKTTALVGRVVALVAGGAAELRAIAAITFTEKAGAELRDRIRRELQRRAADPTAPEEEAERCRAALAQLDGAAIGTLHSFAQRILSEHPIEAELPPRVEVLDEVSSAVAFDRRFAKALDELLEDPALERTLLLLHAAGVDPKRLRSLAQAFDDSWDLVEERVPETAPEPPAVADGLPKVLEEGRALLDLADHCLDPTDKLLGRLHEISAYLGRLGQAGGDDLELIEVLGRGADVIRSSRLGRASSWRGCKADVEAQIAVLAAAVEEARRRVLEACARRLGSALRRHTLDAAHERRRAGELEFHDLLVLARKVLGDRRQGPIVRASLQQRYQRLLLDEFQDTDPIQIELAARIAAADPEGLDVPGWVDVDVAPGRLFIVGDPKQSIYRFRRADIATFLAAKARYAGEAGGTVELTANFRTVAPVIDWVNTTFGALMGEPPEEELPVPSQPDYLALDAQRGAPAGGPAVAVLGAAPHPAKAKADVLRAAEARDVAHAITVAIRDRWPVQAGRDADGREVWRDPTLGDVTVLVPARTSLPFLEQALEDAGIPFRTESSSLVYASRAVRDLLMVLRAADDPTDHLRVVSALRTPLLGCGDDDLFRHKVLERGSWSYNGPTPPDPSGPVGAGLAFLRSLHEERHWRSPAELLDRIARERRALELGFADGRPRDVWRRLRFVIDQARAWSEATGGSLRAYLHWVTQQTVEGARVTESVLPETDDDAVRIMTIHAAKGLEFPITIVSGMSTKPQARPNPVEVVFPRDSDAVGYKLGKDVVTEEFEAWKPIDEQMGYDERIRLLYVACTRACDHLVVSLHRNERRDPPRTLSARTNAELLLSGMGDRIAELPDMGGTAVPLPTDPLAAPSPPAPFEEWAARRAAALQRAARPGAVAATALTDEGQPDVGAEPLPTGPAPAPAGAPQQPSLFDQLDDGDPGPLEPTDLPPADEVDPGLQKRPRDLDLPPWLKGRYGTAVGSAVHGVLQTVDLATGEGLEAAVAAQCEAEAVPDREALVRWLVQAALGSSVVQAAARSPHWREVYACTPVGDRLLEGYVDLLYRGPDGLVVVDHKTADTTSDAELDRRVDGYRLQGAAYALSVAQATGEPVVRVTFLFLTPDGAVERDLPDLDAAVAEVEALVRAGAELVTP